MGDLCLNALGATLNGKQIMARSDEELFRKLPKGPDVSYSIDATMRIWAFAIGDALVEAGCSVTYYKNMG